MTTLFKFFIDNWKFSFLTSAFIFLIGFLSFGLLQRESFPPVNFAVVSVNTVYPGASPDEVQDKVTRFIEEELRGIDGIKDVRSVSQNELSDITIRIDIDGVDSENVVTDIQKAVQRATTKLPPDLPESPVVFELKAKEIPVLELAIVGPNQDRERDKLAELLKESLEDVKGVSNVRLSGYVPRELQVLLNQDKLGRLGVSLTEVFQAIEQQIKNIPAGFVDDKTTVGLVRVFGKNTSPSFLENIIIRSNDAGQSVKVKDIGQVIDGGKKPNLITRVNGEEATLIVTTKKADSDALSAINAVKERVAKFESQLDKRFRLISYNDEGVRISNRLDIVSFNAISGMVIVLLVLFMFLPGKVGLFSSISLPICAVATTSLMVLMGANFNVITMIAIIICLGNLVDNSVVISENYSALREKGVPAKEAAEKSARQFWIPFTASTVTIISAFIPMLVTQGVMGQFIRWIPIVVTIALVLSLIESLTLLPARLQFLNPKPRVAGQNGWFTKVENQFAKLISATIKRKYLTVFTLLVLTLSGIFATAVFNRFELFPAEGVEYYIARFSLAPQTSIYKTDQYSASLSTKVIEVLGRDVVDSVVGRAGIQQVDPSDSRTKVGENVGLLLIGIKASVAPDLNIKDTLAKLKAIPKPDELEKLTFETIENGPPVGKPLTLTLRSSNYKQLSDIRTEMMSRLSKVEGLENLEDDEQDTGIEYQFNPEENAMAYAGLSVDQVGLNLRTALEGSIAAKLSESGKEYDLVVRFSEQNRRNINDLNKIQVLTPKGDLIPLTSLGKFETAPSPKTRKKLDYKNSITITADVDNIKVTSAKANSLARQFYDEVQGKYSEVSVVFGGEEESTKESLQSLAIALVLAIFGIFATLVFTFRSYSMPLLILSTIPLGLVGVFYSFTIVQRPLSFLAFIGVVGLSGVVINSAIILVDYIKELIEAEPDRPLEDILVQASSQRLRAVLATGLTTVVGLLPTAFGWGGYDSILVDITLALSWGMIVGTVLSLVWIPSGFLVMAAMKTKLYSVFRKQV